MELNPIIHDYILDLGLSDEAVRGLENLILSFAQDQNDIQLEQLRTN